MSFLKIGGKDPQENAKGLGVNNRGRLNVESPDQNNSVMGGVQNLTAKNSIPSTYGHNGFSSICTGRNDELFIFYADKEEHGSSRGIARIIKSTDDGIWSEPVTILDEGEGTGVQEVTIMYDAPSDSYIATIVEIDLSDSSQETKFYRITGDVMDVSDWTSVAVTQPFTSVTKAHLPAKRRGRGRLWIAVYGRDEGETGGDQRPAIMESTDDGQSWSLLKEYSETGNEPIIYWDQSKVDENSNVYILLRNTNITSGAKIIATSGVSLAADYEVFDTTIPLAGGANIMYNNGYWTLLFRNSSGGGGSVGAIAYTLDGINFSKWENTDYHYPFQPQFTKTTDGRTLAIGCQEPDSSNKGFIWLTNLKLPPYSEVLEKCRLSEVIVLNRYTTIAASESHTTRYFRNLGRDSKILIRAEGGSGDTIADVAVRFTFWGANGTEFVYDTSISIDLAGPQFGVIDVPDFGKEFTIRFTNNESSSRNLYALMSFN